METETLEIDDVCSAARPDADVIRDILSRIGDKWSLLVMGVLGDGPLRFTALQKRVQGISQRMLTITVRHLERDGLISRTSYPEIPPRVEYEVTALGRTLIEPVLHLARWAAEHQDEIQASRAVFDASAD